MDFFNKLRWYPYVPALCFFCWVNIPIGFYRDRKNIGLFDSFNNALERAIIQTFPLDETRNVWPLFNILSPLLGQVIHRSPYKQWIWIFFPLTENSWFSDNLMVTFSMLLNKEVSFILAQISFFERIIINKAQRKQG